MKRIVSTESGGKSVQQYVLDLLPTYKGKKRSSRMDAVALALEQDIKTKTEKMPDKKTYTADEIDKWVRARTWQDRTGTTTEFDADIKSALSESVSVQLEPLQAMNGAVGEALPLVRPEDDSALLDQTLLEKARLCEELERLHRLTQETNDQAKVKVRHQTGMRQRAECETLHAKEKRAEADKKVTKLEKKLSSAADEIKQLQREKLQSGRN